MHQPKLGTIFKCQSFKIEMVSIIPNSAFPALKNSTNHSMEYESKNSGQLEREIRRNSFFNASTVAVL